jgi:hypothetical protein
LGFFGLKICHLATLVRFATVTLTHDSWLLTVILQRWHGNCFAFVSFFGSTKLTEVDEKLAGKVDEKLTENVESFVSREKLFSAKKMYEKSINSFKDEEG